jgi:hypothetical protein
VRSAADLSSAARALVRYAFDGVDAARVWDSHAHLVGLGTSGTGADIDPGCAATCILRRLQFDVWRLRRVGLDRARKAVPRAPARPAPRREPGGQALLLLAFATGAWTKTAEEPAAPVHVPDDACCPSRAAAGVVACASVHPYRRTRWRAWSRRVGRAPK